MPTKHELLSRLRVSTAHAKGLFVRAEAISASIASLSAPLPEGVDADAILAQAKSMLISVGDSGLDSIAQHLDEQMAEIQQIAAQVDEVALRVANLPQALSDVTLDVLRTTADTIEDSVADLIETATTSFEETEQRVVACIEDTRSRVEALATEAQEAVSTALEDLENVLDKSRADVERIILTLERTRATVLTICNTVGIGASSARPVVETSVSVFSAVG